LLLYELLPQAENIPDIKTINSIHTENILLFI
jgi:hypothetical protein